MKDWNELGWAESFLLAAIMLLIVFVSSILIGVGLAIGVKLVFG